MTQILHRNAVKEVDNAMQWHAIVLGNTTGTTGPYEPTGSWIPVRCLVVSVV